MFGISKYSSYICGSRIDRSSYRSTKVNCRPFLLSFSTVGHKNDRCMEEEIWKDIPGWEGLYQASSLGRIRSLERRVWNHRCYALRKGRILSLNKNAPTGVPYHIAHLYRDKKRTAIAVAILVCTTFNGPKPKSINGDHYVDCMHLNGNSLDNRPENLAWGTHTENMNEANCRRRISEGNQFRNGWVIQLTRDGQEVARFSSVRAASEATNITKSNIATCARGHMPTAGGYKWKYTNRKEK